MNLEIAPEKLGLEVISVNDEKLLSDALRFGIASGEKIIIIKKLPGGPIVIQKSNQQIAIGRELAKAIKVKEKN